MNTNSHISELSIVAKALMAPGKGILAADESDATIQKRFESVNLESNPASRIAYREMLFTAPGAENYISGAILFDETIRQSASSGESFVKILEQKGILPGIKVDMGTEPFGASGEKLTRGLDGLEERVKGYVALGAKFAKWRAVFGIGGGLPTDECVKGNASRLARYAKICQMAGLVPIVEPEVLMDGSHTQQNCEAVTERVLTEVFAQLKQQEVDLTGILLKPNMVVSGSECPEQANSGEVAEATLRVFLKTVPPEVPGIVFLSGGQSPAEATANLNEMNKNGHLPWPLSFSYGRALQAPALQAWAGKPENVTSAQAAFLRRAELNSLARAGTYLPEMENSESGALNLTSQD